MFNIKNYKNNLIFEPIFIKKLNVIIIIIIINLLLLFLFQNRKEVIVSLKTNLVKNNEYYLSNNIKHFQKKSFLSIKRNEKYIYYNSTNFTLNVTSIRYSREIQNKIIKVEYLIGFYDLNKNLISPSDLTLYYGFHVLCYYKNLKNNIFIISLANIYENKNYYCTEFFNKNENIKFGIIIYKISNGIEYYSLEFFTYKIKLYDKYIYKFTNAFNYSLIKEEFDILLKKINNNKLNKSIRLKKSYIQKPFCSTKSNIGKNHKWIFRNIFNHYFCFCKGENCLFYDIPKNCKYYLYLSIIENNKYLYNKTDYLFGDFILNNRSSDDVYPTFTKMMSQNYGVHYMTEKKDIYEKYCKNQSICLTIIKDTFIDGDFLEKYLTLILRLKSVISGARFYSLDDLFYNIEYITYICVGHGVSFFKHFLYSKNGYYGYNKFDKILIPPSKILISVAKQNGWKDKNIIKMNLPRWDKYNIKKEKYVKKNNIFVMFTWRDMKKKNNISKFYFENINELLNNNLLLKNLNKFNVSLYFTFHHSINYKSRIKVKINKNIKYIEEDEISNILSNTSLIVTDFSSIVFDMIYREKPFVIFIPDSNDPTINDIYISHYSELINFVSKKSFIEEKK